jgi:hypothetical protein
MGIYKLVKERYEREARQAEQQNSADQARQRREAELRRDAKKIAHVLGTPDVKRTAVNVCGWHLGTERWEGGSTRIGNETYHFPPREYEWQLGEDGAIYRDGKLCEKLEDGQLKKVEEYLADLAVQNRLGSELFRNDGP